MTLYFIDGKVDCFETSEIYTELENANIIDGADGYTSCFDQFNTILLETRNKQTVFRGAVNIISNFSALIDFADTLYVYDAKLKVFKLQTKRSVYKCLKLVKRMIGDTKNEC